MNRALLLVALCATAGLARGQAAAAYFPAPGQWQHRTPAESGFDPAGLAAAIEFAQAHDSTWDFERDQVRTFGTPLGPLPQRRAATNGIILRHGYIVAEFGDTRASDPVYSVAKSFLSTLCGVAVARGLIKDVNDPLAQYIHDGGYDSPHNARITWKNHLQQESEWEGELWGKNADFVGHQQFGEDERPPRAIQEPGTFYEYNDVRVNRLSLSLLRVFGQPLPAVLKTAIMDPIGASQDWRWWPYGNSVVDIGGQPVGSVSGGSRWGAGLWINSQDMARFGLLILNHGRWQGRQLVPAQWLEDAVTPSAHGPDYGYLWWLNTKRQQWPSAPASSFAALGHGANIIWLDPDHDIVIAWHWFDGAAMDAMIQQVMASIVR